MQARLSQLLLFTVFGGLLLFPPDQATAQQDLIDELRQQALQLAGPDRLGAGYAAQINFAVNPDIPTATFYIKADGIDDPTLHVYRLPLRHVFKLAGRTWRPFVQASVAYQTLDADFGPDHGIGHFGFLRSMPHAHRGGLSGAGDTSTASKIAANIDRGF